MPLYILTTGILLCFSCFAVHIILWRLRKPLNDVRVLLVIFFLLPVPFFLLCLLFTRNLWTIEEASLVFVLHYCLSLAYIASYPAAQAHSPSLDIVLKIARSPRSELTDKEIIDSWGGQDFLVDRIADLKTGGLIVCCSDVFRLSLPGKMLLMSYRAYRRFLGMPFGRG